MTTATFLSKPINDTDANFRAWGSALSAAIQAVGLIKTADTGQISWTTVAKPATANAMQGYEIFRFNDALQSTAPIFIKIEYGSGNYGGVYPAYRTTVGKGTDGAGNITNVLHVAASTGSTNNNSTTDYTSCVSSGDGSMLVFTLWTQSTIATHGWRFALERSRDAVGDATAVGTFCYRIAGVTSADASTSSRSEATDYGAMLTNTTNRGAINTGYEITGSTSLNNGVSTPVFKAEVVTPSRVKWHPRSVVAHAQSDAGILQVLDVGGTNYISLGSAGGQHADVALQRFCCLAIAYY